MNIPYATAIIALTAIVVVSDCTTSVADAAATPLPAPDCPDHGLPMRPTIETKIKADGKLYEKFACSWDLEKPTHYVWITAE